MPPPNNAPFTLLTEAPPPPKPTDIFTTPPLQPHTLFYLTHTVPHTSSFTVYGPTTNFPALIPRLESIVSNSPRAIDKLDALRYIVDVWDESEPNAEFEERGFQKFIVEGQRGTYSILEIVREVNRSVYEEVRAGERALVYVVSNHGPISMTGKGEKGYVETSAVVGSYVDIDEAKGTARTVLKGMIEGVEGVKENEIWGLDGSGVVCALGSGVKWEVKVRSEGRRG